MIAGIDRAGAPSVEPELSVDAAERRSTPSLVIQRPNGNGVRAFVSTSGHVLFIEDDPAMCQWVAGFFGEHNIPVRAVACRHELRPDFAGGDPSLIIFDLCLGGGDGLVRLREIRSRSDVPIIITIGRPYDEIDGVVALELGADNFVIKPFSVRELLARVRAVLRRQAIGRVA